MLLNRDRKKNSLLISIAALVIVFMVMMLIWQEEKVNSNFLMKNGIIFTGIISDLAVSNNHSFGIIKLKIKKSNNRNFINSSTIFPYQIKDSIAEVYHVISYKLKKGMLVKVDSNKQTIYFVNNNNLIYSSELSIITSMPDRKYIMQNTVIK